MHDDSQDRIKLAIQQFATMHKDACPVEIGDALDLPPLKVRAVLMELAQDGLIEWPNDEP